MTIGELIRTRREELGFSQAQLARMVKCRPNFISMIENGHARFPRRKWLAFAECLGLDRLEFLEMILEDLLPDFEDYRVIKRRR